MINLQQSFPRLLYFYYKDIKGGGKRHKAPYTVLRVALVDIGTNKTVRLLENMLLRCVGFSWAKPSVTKSSTHPSVSSVKTHAVLFAAPPNPDIRTMAQPPRGFKSPKTL